MRVPGFNGRARDARTHDDLPAMFDALSVQYVILDIESDGDLHQFMESQPTWSVDFKDREGAVFARASAHGAEGGDR